MREEVKWFGKRMEEKLKDNDHKPHWSGIDIEYLKYRLLTEHIELDEAIKKGDGEEIIKECADVANFAMMIADNLSKREKKPSRLRGTIDEKVQEM